MPNIETPGAIINFDVVGDQGPWVTLINGHTRSSNDFRMMGRIFSQAGMRVLVLDNRGAGKSQVSRPFTITDMCGDVVALWDYLEIEKSSLLGISMGGFISQGIFIYTPGKNPHDLYVCLGRIPADLVGPYRNCGNFVKEFLKLFYKSYKIYFSLQTFYFVPPNSLFILCFSPSILLIINRHQYE